MIKLIVGNKGTGKTKILINTINEAAKTTKGYLVCIDKTTKLNFDIDRSVRIADVDHYGIDNYESFYGFVAGMLAGNYDIMGVYVDSILKVGKNDLDGLGLLLSKLEKLLEKDVEMVFTVSADESDLPESVKKYL
ncbi:MAG: hypothetical protein GX967_02080 [Clostridiales bacterium]|nr:hypothetical protein [Clostridiales bacterium]